MARGGGSCNRLAVIMDKDFNIELVWQLGITPMNNILDSTICRSVQLEVENVKGSATSRADLVGVRQSAWKKPPLVM
jgi:hypothetical protein